MTAGEALAQGRESVPVAEARWLLQHVLGVSAVDLAAHPERPVGEAEAAGFADLLARRAAGEPIAYLLGRREFYGRDFAVSPAVLIPRPETELLVDFARDRLAGRPRPQVLDLGTGSGCLAVTLALETAATVTGVDVAADALAVARGNAQRHAAPVVFVESDWFAAVAGSFDLIVANPPYVAAGDPHLRCGDLRFEPVLALASGPDGLAAIRSIIAGAGEHLLPGGWLAIEHGYDQADGVRELMLAAGMADMEQWRDLAGIVRLSAGRRKAA